ncbi:unnamed protein product [Blepharisma stoltei]|uniref:Uncharacterized protein n=1 Tax=Blepharisma stoltei TaxID=1481888 RepID=A0AAU9JFV9_9CILI|nr:unnamed protein product [Blepharisma stoltei]
MVNSAQTATILQLGLSLISMKEKLWLISQQTYKEHYRRIILLSSMEIIRYILNRRMTIDSIKDGVMS